VLVANTRRGGQWGTEAGKGKSTERSRAREQAYNDEDLEMEEKDLRGLKLGRISGRVEKVLRLRDFFSEHGGGGAAFMVAVKG
jgi:hypothetical protein